MIKASGKLSIITPDLVKCCGILVEVTLGHEYYLNIYPEYNHHQRPEQPMRPFKQYYMLHKPTNTIQQ